MTRSTGRIPASQITSTSDWKLPAVEPDDKENNRVFKVRGKTAPGRLNRISGLSSGNRDTIPSVAEKHSPSNESAIPDEPKVESPVTDSIRDIDPAADSARAEPLPDTVNEPVNLDTADEGYAAGFKKGETEGYIKGESRGFEVGEAAGREQARLAIEKAFEEEVAPKRKILADLEAAFANPPDQSEGLRNALVPLITKITEMVVLNEIKTDPEVVVRVVESALSAVPESVEEIIIKVHPNDLEWVQSFSSDALVSVVADDKLSPGGCTLTTEHSRVDARLSERINRCLLQTFLDEEAESLSESDLLDTTRELDEQ